MMESSLLENEILTIEEEEEGGSELPGKASNKVVVHRNILLVTCYFSLLVGSLSSSLLSRFYFVHGGASRWLSTWVQCAGFPLLAIPICFSSRRPFCRRTGAFGFTFRRLLLCLLIGLLLGVNNFFISWGFSYLPVSTSSLILSSQLAFNLLSSMLLVRQRVYFTNLNCVLLLTLSSVLLALDSTHDRPRGITNWQFVLGFLATLAAAALFAVYLPIMELIYQEVASFREAMEMQMVMQFAATAFATVGMAAGDGFREVRREGEIGFDLGKISYYGVVFATIVSWQLCFMGTAGVVFLTSSLHSGICTTGLLAMNVVGGVVAFGDEFGGIKAVSLALCLWGFISYLHGEYQRKDHERKVGKGNKISSDNLADEHDGTED